MIFETCQKIVKARWFNSFIIITILLASVLVGVTTYSEFYQANYNLVHKIDLLIVWIFVAEALIKILAEGNRPWNYFKNNWNVFDFVIIVACLFPATGHFFLVFRLARILRVLRLVTALPKLQMLVGALVKSLSSITYISLLLSLHFYVFAAIASFLFGGNDPEHFGNLHLSILSLFGVVTLENWIEIMNIQMYGSDLYQEGAFLAANAVPNASPIISPIFFIIFVLSGSMIILNLFIGVIMNGMNDMEREQKIQKIRENRKHKNEGEVFHIHDEIAQLQLMVDELKDHLNVVDALANNVVDKSKIN